LQGLPSQDSHEKSKAMHRWFRFCALIALMAFSQWALAQSPEGDTPPIPKHRIKATPSDLVQFHMEAQGKKVDDLKTQLDAQTKQIDAQTQLITAQTKLLEELGQRSELQTKQIETLNEELNRLNAALLSRNSEPAPEATPVVHTAEPVVSTPTAPVANAPAPNAPGTAAVAPGGPTHVVKQGETLISIARQHGITVSELLKINKIEDERKLQIGQTLLLPPPPKKPDSQ
jgi:LysM repeat protein